MVEIIQKQWGIPENETLEYLGRENPDGGVGRREALAVLPLQLRVLAGFCFMPA